MNDGVNKVRQAIEDNAVLDTVAEAVHSAVFSGAQQPYDGLSQLVNHVAGKKLLPDLKLVEPPRPAEFGSVDWHAQQIGGAIGMTVPFLLINKGVGGVAGRLTAATARSELRLAASIGVSGVSGALYEGVFQPVAAGETNFWAARGKHALTGGITFATLAGVHGGIEAGRAGRLHPEYGFLAQKMSHRLTDGVLSGAIAGGVHAQTASLLDGKGPAGWQATGQSAYGFAMVGGVLGAHKQISENRANRYSEFLQERYGEGWQKDPTRQVRSELLSHIVDVTPGAAPRRLSDYVDWLKPDALGMKEQRPFDIGVWQGRERAAILAEVLRRAESPLGKESTITRAIERLAEASRPWRGRDLEPVDNYLTQSKTKAEEAAAERTRVAESIPEMQGLSQEQLLTDRALIDRHPQYRDALKAEFEAEAEVARAEKYLEGQYEGRAASIKEALNKIARDNGLPAVDFELSADGKMAGGYYNGHGKMMAQRDFLRWETLKTQSVDTLLHEFTHFEQDVLVVRRIADGLEVGRVANFQQMGLMTRAYEMLTGESASTTFIEQVIEHRDGRPLARAQTQRANDLMTSFREYSKKGYTKGDFGEVDQLMRLHDIIDKVSTDEGLALLRGQVTTDADLARLLLGDQAGQSGGPALASHSLLGSGLGSREGAQELIRSKAAGLAPAARERYGGYIGSKLESEAWSVGLLAQVKSSALGLRSFPWGDMRADFGTTGQAVPKTTVQRPAALDGVGRVQTFKEFLDTASLDWLQSYRRSMGIDVRPFDNKLKAVRDAGKK